MIDCAIKVYRHLGPGLLELAYERCLSHALSRNGICCQLQLTWPEQDVDLEKISRDEDRFTDELQRDKAVRWHQTIRSLIPSSYSSCPSWCNHVRRPQEPWNDRGEPERRMGRTLKSTSTAAARLPFSVCCGGRRSPKSLAQSPRPEPTQAAPTTRPADSNTGWTDFRHREARIRMKAARDPGYIAPQGVTVGSISGQPPPSRPILA